MIRRSLLPVLLAVWASAPVTDAVVTFYDNGAPNLMNGFEFTHWKVTNQFTLGADVVTNTVKFWEIEARANVWANQVLWEIRSNSASNLPGTVLFSGSSTNLSRVATSRQDSSNFPEYLITFDLPSVSLPAGTYWLTLHNGALSNNMPPGYVFWETATSNRTDDSKSDEAPFSNNWETNTADAQHPSQLAFQLIGIVRPRVSSFGFTSGAPRVSFTTVTGQNYRVEFKNNLTDVSWSTVSGASTVAGTGGVVQISDSDPNVSNGTIKHRFYRVIVL